MTPGAGRSDPPHACQFSGETVARGGRPLDEQEATFEVKTVDRSSQVVRQGIEERIDCQTSS